MSREEVVIYFEYCREVIPRGWKLLDDKPQLADDPDRLAELLHDFAAFWLEHGQIEGNPTPPAMLIENSRRHMPRLADGTHLDCDCPLFRMMLEGIDDTESMFYPTFSGFYGHHLDLDGEFAFSLCETREEFEQQEAEYRQMNAEIEQNWRHATRKLNRAKNRNPATTPFERHKVRSITSPPPGVAARTSSPKSA